MERIRFNKNLYSRAALLKAAYHFTDKYYIYLDQNETDFLIEMTAKEDAHEENIANLFSNGLLAQATREIVRQQTSNVRELILGRAFGSTIVEESKAEEPAGTDVDGSNIFADWFGDRQ